MGSTSGSTSKTHWQHGSGAILAFVDDATVMGISECEHYTWSYRTDGRLVSFDSGLWLPVCWDCLHLCEGEEIVDGFSGVTQYAVDDRTLTLGYVRDTETFTAIPVPSVDFEKGMAVGQYAQLPSRSLGAKNYGDKERRTNREVEHHPEFREWDGNR